MKSILIRSVSLSLVLIASIVTGAFALAGYRTGNGVDAAAVTPLDSQNDIQQKNENGNTPVTGEENGDIETALPDFYYIAKEYEGQIGIFYSGETGSENEPFIVWDIDIELLREEDRRQFAVGVRLPTYEDVLILYEDFSS